MGGSIEYLRVRTPGGYGIFRSKNPREGLYRIKNPGGGGGQRTRHGLYPSFSFSCVNEASSCTCIGSHD